MNADHFKGKWNQFKGELKKKWAAFTDDDLMRIEGDYDKFKGAIQARYADRKDEISRWADIRHFSPPLLLCIQEKGTVGCFATTLLRWHPEENGVECE